MTLPASTVADAALRAFQLRRARPLPDHEAKLRPWAALALRCGADPAQVSPDAPRALEEYRKAGLSDRHARACLADDQHPFPGVLATLASARDAALDSLPPELGAASQDTQDLVVLAIHFGCPPYVPNRERIAA